MYVEHILRKYMFYPYKRKNTYKNTHKCFKNIDFWAPTTASVFFIKAVKAEFVQRTENIHLFYGERILWKDFFIDLSTSKYENILNILEL